MTAVCAFFNVPSPQHKRWIDAKAKDRWAAVKLTPLADRPQISDGEKTVVQAVRAWQQRGPVKIVVVGIENECSENARAAVRMLRAGGLVLEGDCATLLVKPSFCLKIMQGNAEPAAEHAWRFSEPPAAPAASAGAAQGKRKRAEGDAGNADESSASRFARCVSWVPSDATPGFFYYADRHAKWEAGLELKRAMSKLPPEDLEILYQDEFVDKVERQRIMQLMGSPDVYCRLRRETTMTYKFLVSSGSREVGGADYKYGGRSRKQEIASASIATWDSAGAADDGGGGAAPAGAFEELLGIFGKLAARLNDLHADALEGRRFNMLLVQEYRDDHDMLSWHQDTNGDLADGSPSGQIEGSPVASISLGATRDFGFCKDPFAGRGEESGVTTRHHVAIRLPSGCLLTMLGSCNAGGVKRNAGTGVGWYHALLRRQENQKCEHASWGGRRVNLTFRVAPGSSAEGGAG